MSDITPWHSFRLRKAKDPNRPVIGAYGGHPRGIRAHQWPRCSVCGAPMCHMAQLDAGPWLDLGPHSRLTVFICHATGGRCEDWDPWKGSNKALLSRVRDDNLYDGPPTVRVYRRMPLMVDPPLDERAVMAQVRTHGVPVKTALEQLRHDKLGGGAVWLHGDDTPQSQAGQGPMRLLLQLTTDVVKFDITTGGMGYVFIDPYDASENAARFLWQGGLTMLVWLAVAGAQEVSQPASVVFSDSIDVFSFAAVDSGWQPSASSALAVRFQVVPTGGVVTEMEAVSELTWTESAFQHTLVPVVGAGLFGVDTAIDIDFDVKIDVSVWDGTLDVWNAGFSIVEIATFDSLLLDGGAPSEMEITVDDVGVWQPFSTTIGIIPTVNLEVAVDVIPELTSIFSGSHIDTQLLDGSGSMDGEGTFLELDLPTEPMASVDLTSTYHGQLYNLFAVVCRPSLTLDSPIGDWELAAFDIPFDLLDLASDRTFEAVTYAHPLPAVSEVVVPPVDDVLVGTQINVEIPLQNMGDLVLEGTARVEGGDAFSVWPPYFAATTDQTAGVVVTFAPSEEGDHQAFLVLETNDPTLQFLRIPLNGTAFGPDEVPDPNIDDPDESGVRARTDGKACGCQTSRPPFGLLALGLALPLLRRRR